VTITFALVDPAYGLQAYNWHRGFAAANPYLLPRPRAAYQQLAKEGRIWCARNTDDDFVGLSYFSLDGKAWEIGGVMVNHTERGKGIGTTLAHLTLAHVLFAEDPLANSERVIAHVHKQNPEPRPIFEGALKFRLAKTIKEPAARLPGLKANAEGFVEGDEFRLHKPDTLIALARWCKAWTGTLGKGETGTIELMPNISLSEMADAFEEMAR
jgi:RimJ/RimL family protein N-acetyltransferase